MNRLLNSLKTKVKFIRNDTKKIPNPNLNSHNLTRNIQRLLHSSRYPSNEAKDQNLKTTNEKYAAEKSDFVLADHMPVNVLDPGYFNYSNEFLDSKYVNSKKNLILWKDFITDSEHDLLMASIEKKLRRYCRDGYAMGHFDKRITNYREFSYSSWLPVHRLAPNSSSFQQNQSILILFFI
ncbi:hypothetical protein AYI69_g846 [Smittium culicis]|uniref:Uncharacterized protein n=1 Tax=Smittium culicis TaxID=133412 RepID=A0A1R1YS19_9FUNG|nr:hypothetical protein AYI69_g846 [Smittium culicis]